MAQRSRAGSLLAGRRRGRQGRRTHLRGNRADADPADACRRQHRRAHRHDRHAASDGQARQGHRPAHGGDGDRDRARRPHRRGESLRLQARPRRARGAAALSLAAQDLSAARDRRGALGRPPGRVASADRRALRGRPARVAFEPRHGALSLARRPLRGRARDPAGCRLRRDGPSPWRATGWAPSRRRSPISRSQARCS